jgi:hypothetical protein
MSEFGGCSRAGKQFRLAFTALKGLADYNYSGSVNRFMKIIQKQDTVSPLGRRSITLSKHPRLLEGFSLNKGVTFDSIMRNRLAWSLDRKTRTARVDIPKLLRDVNFFPQNQHAMFSIVVSVGVAPDFAFDDSEAGYASPRWYFDNASMSEEVHSPWYPARKGAPASTLEVTLKEAPADESYCLMLSIGIRFGAVYEGGIVEQVKRTGAAKIIAIAGADDTRFGGGGQDKTDRDLREEVILPAAAPVAAEDYDNYTPAARVAAQPVVWEVYSVRHSPEAGRTTETRLYTYRYDQPENRWAQT